MISMMLFAALHFSPVGSDLNLPDPCTHTTLPSGARVTLCAGAVRAVTSADGAQTRTYHADGAITISDGARTWTLPAR